MLNKKTITEVFELKGSMVPLVTPLKEDESVDTAAVERLMKFHKQNGTSAVVLFGTCGEGPALTDTAKENLLTSVTEHSQGLPVIAGIIETGTKKAAHAASWLSQKPIEGFLVMGATFINAATIDEHLNHFTAVASQTSLPIFLYNLPKKTGGQPIPLPVVQQLLERGVINGIKESSGDLDYLQSLLKLRNDFPKFKVCNGELRCAAEALRLGVDGLIMSVTNFDPASCNQMLCLAKEGNFDKAREIQLSFESILDQMPGNTSPAAKVKAVLGANGLCSAKCCGPVNALKSDYKIKMG